MTLSVNDFTAGDVITASAMNTNFATIEGYVNSSPGLAQLTGATFSGAVTFSAGITSTGGTTALGNTTATTLTTSGAGASDNNVQITFAEGYAIHADNTGSGSDSSRLWFEAPDNGEMILGPRASGQELHRIRLRAATVAVDTGNLTASGTATVDGLITANGGLTIQNGDTFTFNNVGLTSVIASTEGWASNNTSIATTGAINSHVTGLGYKKITIQPGQPSGVEGDIWIDT